MENVTLGGMRYYEKGFAGIGGYGQTGLSTFYEIEFKAVKRAAPTLGYGSISAVNVSVFDARVPTVNGLQWFCQLSANGGYIWKGSWTANAEL